MRSLSLVRYRDNDYSVPVAYGDREVVIRGYVDQVVIGCGAEGHGPALEFLEHTIDGRRPFADKEKDFELLDTAFNKLAGVPKMLVVTSAEEFLTSRTASFETGWQAEQAG